jgi:D-glycero-beta-D-manno-heptose 1-phosphate adenylyltransferase
MSVNHPLSFERKCATWSEAGLASPWSALPRPWVFTNGCFDLLHRGHVTYLAQAKTYGATLIVALNTDASIKRLNKGIDQHDVRPIHKLDDRMCIIAALESVDVVLSFDDDTPRSLILALRPDVLVKGGDWPVEEIVGAPEVQAWGGQVFSIPFQVERSTSGIVRQLRSG